MLPCFTVMFMEKDPTVLWKSDGLYKSGAPCMCMYIYVEREICDTMGILINAYTIRTQNSTNI